MSERLACTFKLGGAAERFDALQALHFGGREWRSDVKTWGSAPVNYAAYCTEREPTKADSNR